MRNLALAGFLLAIVTTDSVAIGPHNVVIVVSEKSPEALALANYYADRRGIPKNQIVRIRVPPLESFKWKGYKKYVVDVVENHIRLHDLQDRIAVWATMPGCPFIVDQNSSSGVIFFGSPQSPNPGPGSPGKFSETNSYFDRMVAYRRPKDAKSGGYLAMRVDAGSADATRKLIDNSVASDGSYPDGTIYLMDGEGPRSSRKDSIPMAQKLLEVLGQNVVHRPDAKLQGANDVLGLYTGLIWMNVPANRYIPGALADHLTSFGGRMRLYRGQLPASDFLAAGCSASYGTVVEPYNYPAKFPTALLHLYYALGFTAAESYWMSVAWPQQGLFVGDPLTRPFGKPPSIAFSGIAPGDVLTGVSEFDVVAQAPDGEGVAGLQVFVDGEPVHQNLSQRIPEDTTLEIAFGERKADYLAIKGQTLGEAIVGLGSRAASLGMQVTARPGLIFVLQPTGSGGELTAKSSSSLVPMKILGTKLDESEPVPGLVEWKIAGKAAAGDSLTLAILEKNKILKTLMHTVPFERAAANVCTSLRLDWQSKMPDGYRLETELTADNPNVGIVRIHAEPKAVAKTPAASITLKAMPGSSLAVPDNGRPRGLAGQGLAGLDIGCVRIGIGPNTLRARPAIDTKKFADGRHRVEIIATLGSAIDAQSYRSFPIVVRNGEERFEILPVQTALSIGQPGLVEVAKVELPPQSLNRIKFFVDGNVVQAKQVRNGSLTLDPNRWGVGTHQVTAGVRQKESDAIELFADNEVDFTVVNSSDSPATQ